MDQNVENYVTEASNRTAEINLWNLTEHAQIWYPFIRSMHRPPWRHGADWQSSMLVSQLLPVMPGIHSHR